MLCFSRTIGQDLIIFDENKPDEKIEIKFMKRRGTYTTLAINAPANIKIYRGEIWREMEKKKEGAE